MHYLWIMLRTIEIVPGDLSLPTFLYYSPSCSLALSHKDKYMVVATLVWIRNVVQLGVASENFSSTNVVLPRMLVS